jgi:ring-1,2-phenylacetyl-CoA epoxidase subunit PaaC
MTPALFSYILSVADDLLIMGHRHSEWIGLGPLLEEDISFASIAQDKVGQSRVLYNLLHQWGELDADTQVFTRPADKYLNCHLVELSTPEYEQALVRHYLVDEALALYFKALQNSQQPDLAAFARKFSGENKYHTLHAQAMLKQLYAGSDDARARIQAALALLWPYCGGLFEERPNEATLVLEGLVPASEGIREEWLSGVLPFVQNLGFEADKSALGHLGGRLGHHTEYLAPLLEEMGEVYNLDPTAKW